MPGKYRQSQRHTLRIFARAIAQGIRSLAGSYSYDDFAGKL